MERLKKATPVMFAASENAVKPEKSPQANTKQFPG
jgi:hypothetical protein